MRRALLWVLKLLFARLIWNRVRGRLRLQATRFFNMQNLFGESVADWWRLRKLK